MKIGLQDERRVTLEALVARVSAGAMVAVPPDYSYVAMAATRALVRAGLRNLHLLCVPQAGIQADLLIGAGAVGTIETAAVSLGEQGQAPRFTQALKAGDIHIKDSTCPAIHAALQASEKGLPFLPLRGLIGSDLLSARPDWRTIENPFQAGDAIVVLPALAPDIALFHAPLADRFGNVWIGRRRELVTMAHAARETLVTVEKIQDESLLDDPRLVAGVLPALYVSAVAPAPKGAWPLGLSEHYAPDTDHLAHYARAAKTAEGFAAYLDEFVLGAEAAE
jgi:glutaconate CoA-transferase subunit A